MLFNCQRVLREAEEKRMTCNGEDSMASSAGSVKPDQTEASSAGSAKPDQTEVNKYKSASFESRQPSWFSVAIQEKSGFSFSPRLDQ